MVRGKPLRRTLSAVPARCHPTSKFQQRPADTMNAAAIRVRPRFGSRELEQIASPRRDERQGEQRDHRDDQTRRAAGSVGWATR